MNNLVSLEIHAWTILLSGQMSKVKCLRTNESEDMYENLGHPI